MNSEKIARWEGMTQSHAFVVKVFEDREQGLFTAHVEAHSPALAQIVRPGHPTPTMKFEEAAQIRSDSLDTLEALTRKLIGERFGDILRWQGR